MALFNSLGSNYSRGFVLKSLFGFGTQKDLDDVRGQLKETLGGDVELTYKGRQALELALRRSGLPAGSRVGINGFTCYVVYQAVENAGLEPVFVDVAKNSLHFDATKLEKAKNLKAIIVQNTLGLPVDVAPIEKHCKKNDLLLIEDLAHSFGAVYEDGRDAGTVGTLAMLSFSQDKQQDVVAGGALIDHRKQTAVDTSLQSAGLWTRAKNRAYPFWSCVIRTGYSLGVGKYIHFTLKKLHLLSTPMSDNAQGLATMTPLAARLLKSRLKDQTNELVHRRTIAAIYQKELPKNLQYSVVGEPSFLRFPLRVNKPAKLIAKLKEHEMYFGDTWYDAPIAPKRYLTQTNYEAGDCPNAEMVVKHIINLPTHRHISENDAKEICAVINNQEGEL